MLSLVKQAVPRQLVESAIGSLQTTRERTGAFYPPPRCGSDALHLQYLCAKSHTHNNNIYFVEDEARSKLGEALACKPVRPLGQLVAPREPAPGEFVLVDVLQQARAHAFRRQHHRQRADE